MLLYSAVLLLTLFGGKVLADVSVCLENQVDVNFILDASKAVNEDEHERIMDFVKDLVTRTTFNETAVQFGFIRLSTTAKTVFSFVKNDGNRWTKDEVISFLEGEHYDGGLTGLGSALDEAAQGSKGRRSTAQSITIIITAGSDNKAAELLTYASKLKLVSEVFVIALGQNVDHEQPDVMATDPLYNLYVEDVYALDTLSDAVLDFLCRPCNCSAGLVCSRSNGACFPPITNCEPGSCDPNAFCTDTVTSFTCKCRSSYIGLFGICISLLPCNENEMCGANEVCRDTQTEPLYECQCGAGYTGVAGSCAELKCFHEQPCDINAKCTDNSDLSVNCQCFPPFLGTGTPGNCISCGDEHVRLVFVLDTAKGDIDFKHFYLIQVFLKELVNLLTISEGSMSVAVITTTPVKLRIDFDRFKDDKRLLMEEMSLIQEIPGTADMVQALTLAQSILPAPGLDGLAPRNVVMVLTSGMDNEDVTALTSISTSLKDTSKAEIFVIGLGPPCDGGCGEGEVCDRPFKTCVQDVNECEPEPKCQKFAVCTNLPLSKNATCSCKYQFVKYGKPGQEECYSPSACLKDEHDCDMKNGICVDSFIPGDYSCMCKSDFAGDGKTCTVIPCSPSDDTCDPNAQCIAPDGTSQCTCLANYAGDGTICTAIPCSSEDDTCDANAMCDDVDGKAKCTCKPNFSGDGLTCAKIPCSELTCGEKASCRVVDGNAECSCWENYEGDGHSCTLIPCTPPDTTCGANADCTNVDGAASCACKTNYQDNGSGCLPIPCGPADDIQCDGNANCTVVDGESVCVCKQHYEGDGLTCSVKPCGPLGNPCDSDALCTHENNVIMCDCKTGYYGDGSTCTDKPCSTAYNPCASEAVCNDDSGVTCTCQDGFYGDGNTCSDKPCATIYNPCASEAVCNDDGAVTCTCQDGYYGDGKTCNDKPCATIYNPCASEAVCNDDGAVTCTCQAGYYGDGKTCNEKPCHSNEHDCDDNAACVDSDEFPYYWCDCDIGYYGWGYDGLCHSEDLLDGCEARDVIFLILNAYSMNMGLATEFAAKTVNLFPPDYKVAIMTYTDHCIVKKPFDVTPHYETAYLLRSITHTNELVPSIHSVALEDVVHLLVGKQGDRANVDNVVIVVTNGHIKNQTQFDSAAATLKSLVSRVILVTVEESLNLAALSQMVTPGTEESNVFNIMNMEDDLMWTVDSVTSSLVCPNVFEQYLFNPNK